MATSDILTYLPSLLLGAYGLVGGFAVFRWARGYRRQRRTAIHANPEAWLASWFLPGMVVCWVAVLGAILTIILEHFTPGMGLTMEVLDAWFWLYMGFAFLVVFLVGVDMTVWVSVYTMTRRVPPPSDEE